MGHEYDGPERRSGERRGVIDIPTRSAEVAAHAVAQRYRWRPLIVATLGGFLASAVLMVAFVLVVESSRRDDAKQFARFNCDQGAERTAIQAAFIRSDARLRRRQLHYKNRAKVLAAFSTLIEPKLLARLQARADRIDRETTAYWKGNLLPRLRKLAEANCESLKPAKGKPKITAPPPASAAALAK